MDALPLLPASLTCFEAAEVLDPGALLAELRTRLAARRAETEHNPFGNPIQLLALDLGRRLDAGELSLAAIEQLIQRLTTLSFAAPGGPPRTLSRRQRRRRQSGDGQAPDREPGA